MKQVAFVAAAILISAAPAGAAPLDDVKSAFTKFAAAASYEMTVPTESGTATVDVVKPDRMHVMMGPMEMYRLGSDGYVNIPGRGWTKTSSRMGPQGPAFATVMNVDSYTHRMNDLSASDLGMRAPKAGGSALHAYRVTDKDGQSMTLYVGSDGLPKVLEPTNAPAVTFSKYNAIDPASMKAPI